MYLHSQDIIHCDIKPANWLVDGRGEDARLRLADFGMAVQTDAREIVGGSPVYMAPEHLLAWRDLSDKFDHRTDIYSLGVVLYEMLMGYLPYEVLEADSDAEVEPSLSLSSGLDYSENQNNNDGNGNENNGKVESVAKALEGLSLVDDGKNHERPSIEEEQVENKETESSSIDDDDDCGYPVLDLRKLNDVNSDQPFYIPPPIFIEEISEEAQDLIMRLMEPSASKRITLEEAKDHEWFQKVLL